MIKDIFKNNQKQIIYETMLEEFVQNHESEELLVNAMDIQNFQTKKTIPLRYRLIAMAFIKQMSVEDLNNELINNGCQPLYARSSFEATIIYALYQSLSYKQWLSLNKICEKARKDYFEKESVTGYFKDGKITFRELEQYVLEFSQLQNGELHTKQLTKELSHEIKGLSKDFGEFLLLYINNLEKFSEVREKTRYYFCKYLYYHLLDKIDVYKKRVINRAPTQEELLNLLPIKVESKLRRRVVDEDKLMEIIRDCSISPGEIFEEFNYYFFGYISSDWIEICLEEAGGVDELTKEQVTVIADYLRRNIFKNDPVRLEYNDNALVAYQIEQIHKIESEEKTSRKGEKVIRKYLRGDLDLNRTTLVCFLLFFGSSVISREDIRINESRINEILDECGFSMLRKKDPFDHFVITYLKQKDPVSYLMEEMDEYIENGKSIFLYEMYKDSKSNAKEIRKIMINE